MKRNLKIVFIVIVGVSIVIPLIAAIVSYNTKEDAQILSELTAFATSSTTMFSGLCGLATFFIAILLYDRYGVEENTSKQSIEAIDKLIDEMQRVKFFLCYYTEDEKGDKSDYIFSLSIQSSKDSITELMTEQSLSTTLFYKDSGMYGCVQLVERNCNSIYLPKSISQALLKLSVFQYDTVTIETNTRPITTLSASSEKIDAHKDKLNAEDCKVPKTAYSVIQFLDAYFAVKEEIVKWYKTNGIEMSKLNISPFE